MAVHGYRKFVAENDELCGPCLLTVRWSDRVKRAYCMVATQFTLPESEVCYTIAREHILDLSSGCHCGLYAYKDRNFPKVGAWSAMFPNNVTAAVTMWGAIAEYEHGYRAEYMQVDYLWLDGPSSYGSERQAHALAARYGVGCDISPAPSRAGIGDYVWVENACQVVFRKGGELV